MLSSQVARWKLEMVQDVWGRLDTGTGSAALSLFFKGKMIVGWLILGHFSGSLGLEP